MTSSHHTMTIEADNSDELLLVCDEQACGRRLVIKRSGDYVVLDKGDFFATHSGGRGITMTVEPRKAALSRPDFN